MSDKRCPTERDLSCFVDADLSPEQLRQVEKHLERCRQCAEHVAALRMLIADVAAPLPQAELDVFEHSAEIMRRLDAPAHSPSGPRWAAWTAALAAAAVVALVAVRRGQPSDEAAGELAARGVSAERSSRRDVGVRLHAGHGNSVAPLEPGARVRAGTALTAALRNLSGGPAYLLLFAVDRTQTVHWIAPEYTAPGSDPQAIAILPSTTERLLPSAVVFDDLAPGPLRVVALITSEPMRVSSIEALSKQELGAADLGKRFPRAELREFKLEVEP